MNMFKFVRCSKNDVRVRSMLDKMVFDPSLANPFDLVLNPFFFGRSETRDTASANPIVRYTKGDIVILSDNITLLALESTTLQRHSYHTYLLQGWKLLIMKISSLFIIYIVWAYLKLCLYINALCISLRDQSMSAY